ILFHLHVATGLHPIPHSFPTRRSSDLILVHRVKLRIGIEGYAPVIRGMAIDGHRDPQADTEVIKDNGCLSGVSDTVTPAHRSAFVNQEPYCQPLFINRKSTRLNSSHVSISYAVFCLKKKKTHQV